MLKDEYEYTNMGQAQVKHNIIKIFLCSFTYELKLCVIYDLTTFAIKKTERELT